MILIADSGSTKTDWVLLDEGIVFQEFKSEGLNPYFLEDNQIYEIIDSIFQDFSQKNEVSKIYFYGAGCNAEIINSRIENELKKLFFNAEIEVESDMLGVSRSVFGKSSGVAIILGTGSNSCLYDDGRITKQIGSFGYILGDEGSGSNIGKAFITSYLNNELPKEIMESFEEEYQLDSSDIIEHVYRKQFPNRFLALFTKFIANNINNLALYEIVKNSFRSLFHRKLSKYNLTNNKLAFVGSIAFYFYDILNEVAEEFSVKIDKIDKTPMKGLVEFHS